MKPNERNVATEQTMTANWGDGKPGVRFRCYLCGHKFAVGDGYVLHVSPHIKETAPEGTTFPDGGTTRLRVFRNFISCDSCREEHGEHLIQVWSERLDQAKRLFWWLE